MQKASTRILVLFLSRNSKLRQVTVASYFFGTESEFLLVMVQFLLADMVIHKCATFVGD
jgi:hypothetical protein